jgi:threonylcarbamoyladenosine tRNA methylthiotransferase MtaB
MKREAEAAGLKNAILINTCAVTNEAVRQARQAVRKAKRDNPGAKVIVTGCAAQTESEHLFGDGRGRSGARQYREAGAQVLR